MLCKIQFKKKNFLQYNYPKNYEKNDTFSYTHTNNKRKRMHLFGQRTYTNGQCIHEIILKIPGGASDKVHTCQCRRLRDESLIPELGRSPRGGHDDPLQYPCQENLMDKGAWLATVQRVTKSRT